MAMWHCYDALSGERFEVKASDAESIERAVREYIAAGIDDDTGTVAYHVTCTAVDGSEYVFDGEVDPKGGA